MTTPQVLGERYEIGGVLGRGGMAEVHRGRDLRLGREVAVKVLRSDLARDPSFQVRFRREAQAAASLNHPAIVAVYDTGEDRTATGATPYIVMEYVEGETLRDVLRREGRLDPQRAMTLAADICGALDFSHRNGIVHRDVKPGNVMITPEGSVKVMDFGIARAVSDSAATMTSTAAVIGTAQYLSPEQARGESVDARSDVYSVGCLLYELVTGAPPFTGDSPVSVAYQHVREDPRLPSSINPVIPPALDAILLKAMSKNPANRYQSAAEMRNDLLRAVAGQRVEATPVMGDDERTTILGAAPAGYGYGQDYGPEDWSDEDEEAYRRQRRRRMVLIGSVVGVLVIAGIVAAVLALNGGGGTKAPPVAATVAVPNVVGQEQDAATQSLQSQGLKVTASTQPSTAEEKGKVLKTTPAGGAQVAKGSTVALVVGAGPNTVSIPDVVGKTVSDAKAAIQSAGFTGNITVNEVSSLQPEGQVISTEPSVNSDVNPDTTIVLNVSKGSIPVPDVTGRSESAARQKLVSAGIDPGHIDSVDVERDDVAPGTVVSSTPTAGQTIGPDDTITLQIARPTPPQPTTPTTSSAPASTTAPTPTTTSPSETAGVDGGGSGNG
jgi:serine/threonine-protein kinase